MFRFWDHRACCLGLGAVIALGTMGIGMKDVRADEVAASSAVIQMAATLQPKSYYKEQTISRPGTCEIQVHGVEAEPAESKARSVWYKSRLSDLDFARAAIVDVPTEMLEGALILIRVHGRHRVQKDMQFIEPDDDFRDWISKNDGTCDGQDCRMQSLSMKLRIYVMVDNAKAQAAQMLESLKAWGAACGAPGT